MSANTSKSDFRSGIRYGKGDHSIRLDRPPRPDWMSEQEYDGYPDFIMIREIKIRVENRGFRTREIIVHTSLWDDMDYSTEDIAALFRRRWQTELNLRSLKTVIQMDHLRCMEPHRVRNEMRTHMLAYNLIRQVMCEAAMTDGLHHWQISFKGTLATLTESLPTLRIISNADERRHVLYQSCRRHPSGSSGASKWQLGSVRQQRCIDDC